MQFKDLDLSLDAEDFFKPPTQNFIIDLLIMIKRLPEKLGCRDYPGLVLAVFSNRSLIAF